MLTRLYIDNYKTFSNFELQLGKVQLLLGRNGTGKTSVLEVLSGLQALICDGADLSEVFPWSSVPPWLQAPSQRFELVLQIGSDTLTYRLRVEQEGGPGHARIASETLHAGTTPLFVFEQGQIQLHTEQGAPGPRFPARTSRSGLDTIVPAPDSLRLVAFKDWLSRVLLVHPVPSLLRSSARGEAARLAPSLSNFAEWYRGLQQARPMDVVRGQASLREAIIGFEELAVEVDAHRTGWLRVRMSGPQGPYRLFFEDLSDGQRVLFVLYIILHAASDAGRLLVLDEPDNFVALSELQPFLNELLDRSSEPSGPQVLLISHHPEFINPLASSAGLVLYREGGGPTRMARQELKRLP